jgi:hypothetical protein
MGVQYVCKGVCVVAPDKRETSLVRSGINYFSTSRVLIVVCNWIVWFEIQIHLGGISINRLDGTLKGIGGGKAWAITAKCD